MKTIPAPLPALVCALLLAGCSTSQEPAPRPVTPLQPVSNFAAAPQIDMIATSSNTPDAAGGNEGIVSLAQEEELHSRQIRHKTP